MLLRTHVLFGIFLALLFLEYVPRQFLFVVMVLIGVVVPDLDSTQSSYGRHLIFRPLQLFTKHRGVLHSLLMAVFFSLLLGVFYPAGSFGFFLGYASHLLLDSFTIEGIYPFWPIEYKCAGFVRTGGRSEEVLFFVLLFFILLSFVFFLIDAGLYI